MTADQETRKAPPDRPGPRPLHLHMALQGMTWLASRSALPFLKTGWQPWSQGLVEEGESLARELAGVSPEALTAAVDAEAAARLAQFLQGVAAYRGYPDGNRGERATVIWSQGTTRLLDFGGENERASAGAPVLIVPSLVNRYYILDLKPGRSLIAHLAESGLRPLVIDWGAPGPDEQSFALADYIDDRLGGALDAVQAASGRQPAVLGYCMGGLLALALAARRPDDVAALALLATPWDFNGIPVAKRQSLAAAMPGIEAAMSLFNALPVDLLQALFAMLDPWLTVRKFRRFAETSDDSGAHLFVSLEDWLNDGVPLVVNVARETLYGWYGDNAPMKGTWDVAGTIINPSEIEMPAILMIPSHDHIVPPATAWPLANALPQSESHAVSAGHIGMVAGGRAKALVFDPLAEWLGKVCH